MLYKPVAATIYAAAFKVTGSALTGKLEGAAESIVGLMSGLVLMVAALFALPAMMRLIVPQSVPLQQAAQCSRVLLSAVPHLVRSIMDPRMAARGGGPVVVAAVALLVQADPVQAVAGAASGATAAKGAGSR